MPAGGAAVALTALLAAGGTLLLLTATDTGGGAPRRDLRTDAARDLEILDMLTSPEDVWEHYPGWRAAEESTGRAECQLAVIVHSDNDGGEARAAMRETAFEGYEKEVCHRFFVIDGDWQAVSQEEADTELLLGFNPLAGDALVESFKWALEKTTAPFIAFTFHDTFICIPRILNVLSSASRYRFKYGTTSTEECTFNTHTETTTWVTRQDPFFQIVSRDMAAALVYGPVGDFLATPAGKETAHARIDEAWTVMLSGRIYHEHDADHPSIEGTRTRIVAQEPSNVWGCYAHLAIGGCDAACQRDWQSHARVPLRLSGTATEVFRTKSNLKWNIDNAICEGYTFHPDLLSTPPYITEFDKDREEWLSAWPDAAQAVRDRVEALTADDDAFYAVLGVVSNFENRDSRDVWRNMVAQSQVHSRIKVLFLVERSLDNAEAVQLESDMYRDLVALERPFKGAHVTGVDYDLVMALVRWMTRMHPRAEWYAYTTDTTFVSVWRLLAVLEDALVASAPDPNVVVTDLVRCSADIPALEGPIFKSGFMALTAPIARGLAYAWPPLAPNTFEKMLLHYIQGMAYTVYLDPRILPAGLVEIQCLVSDPIVVHPQHHDNFVALVDQDNACKASNQDPTEPYHLVSDPAQRYFDTCPIPPFSIPETNKFGVRTPRVFVWESLCAHPTKQMFDYAHYKSEL